MDGLWESASAPAPSGPVAVLRLSASETNAMNLPSADIAGFAWVLPFAASPAGPSARLTRPVSSTAAPASAGATASVRTPHAMSSLFIVLLRRVEALCLEQGVGG